MLELAVGDRDRETVAERAQLIHQQFLLLVGDVHAFARRAHPVPFDGLGQNDGRRALVLGRRLVGGIHLERIVAAAIERPHLVVGQPLDQRARLRIPAEELLAHVVAVARLERLVVAVERFAHQLDQHPGVVGSEQRIPTRAPQDLDDVPAGAAEDALELLNDLAVAAHRPVEPLQVGVDDEDEVVELFARGQREAGERLGLVHLSVTEESPHLSIARIGETAVVQVAHVARLIDRLQRPQAHRDRRELPEVRHQPRMRIRRDPFPVDLAAEVDHLLFGDAPFEEGARVDPRRGMALKVDQIAAAALRRAPPKVIEADVVQRRRRRERREVTAEIAVVFVGAHHHRQRVPADVVAQPLLDLRIAGKVRLLVDRDRVDVGGRLRGGRPHAARRRALDDRAHQLAGAAGAFGVDDAVERVEPLARLLRIGLRARLGRGAVGGEDALHGRIDHDDPSARDGGTMIARPWRPSLHQSHPLAHPIRELYPAPMRDWRGRMRRMDGDADRMVGGRRRVGPRQRGPGVPADLRTAARGDPGRSAARGDAAAARTGARRAAGREPFDRGSRVSRPGRRRLDRPTGRVRLARRLARRRRPPRPRRRRPVVGHAAALAGRRVPGRARRAGRVGPRRSDRLRPRRSAGGSLAARRPHPLVRAGRRRREPRADLRRQRRLCPAARRDRDAHARARLHGRRRATCWS